ncbi:MAG: thioredoxin domain-containing protein [Bryobacteraceae bacterium]|nr:thioredoxin domain-containing protein [Bryobacteraceae bacterium]
MHTNALIHEKSPYLLQHAHNPVDWLPWGEAAFAKARAEDRPIFLSIGYSTCHWCHVMERESFENGEIAALLNRFFVPVKVDREERPDVDRLYMTFVQATTGSGGWPLSVWLTPDLRPFYGGTYFPPESRWGRPGFRQILEQIALAWQTNRAKILEAGLRIQEEIQQAVAVEAGGRMPAADAVHSGFQQFRRSFDAVHGGFGGAPKFPRPAVLHFLFRYFRRMGNAEALEMARRTLVEMRRGGMYDQVGGGFHRYSVDERWFVPHFEKMLYDQAQLAAAYLEAAQITGKAAEPEVLLTAQEICEYVLRDMTHPEGAFYSAEDADSEDPARPGHKGEGAFYLWSWEEMERLLGEDLPLFAACYGCRARGNVDHDPHGEFEGRNILWMARPELAADPAVARCRGILFEARSKRPRPHRDDKVLAAWNGLMISALARVGAATGEARYVEAARRAFAFLEKALLLPDGRLLRRWREGEAAVPAMLDDYAALALAAIDLHQAVFEEALLGRAVQLARVMIELFEDAGGGGFFTSPASASDLLFRMKEDYDGAEPSGNSLAVEALLRLARLTGDDSFLAPARRTLEAFASRLEQQPSALPRMLAALLLHEAPPVEIEFRGAAEALLGEFHRHFEPFATARWTGRDGPGQAVVCTDFVCKPAVSYVEELRALLHWA